MTTRRVLFVAALALLVLLGLACTFVAAQDDQAAAAAAGLDQSQEPAVTGEEAAADANAEVPPANEGRPDKPNPWVKQKLSGLALGENSALAIPVPILIAIFFAFLAAVGYGIMQILQSEKKRLSRADEKKAKKAEKEAKKGASKKKL